MPTTPPPAPKRLEQRLEDAARAWLSTVPALAAFAKKERDEDGNLQDPEVAPAPILILVARDEGHFKPGTPIRNVTLSIIVRSNTKVTGAGAFSAMGGALELALEATNLPTALSTPEIAVMLATRKPGIQIRRAGLVREGAVLLDCKCVLAERTVQGSGVLPPVVGG